MRVPPLAIAGPPPLWPPLLATRAPGARSAGHAHHAIHVVLALDGTLSVTAGAARAVRAPGVVTAPDVAHAIDATGTEVLLVFLDPESDAGASLRAAFSVPIRIVTETERARILASAELSQIMREGGVAWTAELVLALGGPRFATRRVHPRVRKLLRHLRDLPVGDDASLDALAAVAGLSPGRLMHAFTDSIGLPLRPYLAWLKLQRAAAAIVSGAPLAQAAHAAGFADAAHMTRSFRRMFGMTPSALRPAKVAS